MKLIIEGPFTDADVRKIMLCIREIEQTNPTADYTTLFEDANMTSAESVRFLARIHPPAPDCETDVFVVKKDVVDFDNMTAPEAIAKCRKLRDEGIH